MTPQLADQLFFWAVIIVPVPLVVAFRWIGLTLGTVVVWTVGIVAGIVLSELDPQRNAGVIDTIWLAFGWIAGLLYCLLILGIRELVRYFLNRVRTTVADGN